jgi:hypothetical protein
MIDVHSGSRFWMQLEVNKVNFAVSGRDFVRQFAHGNFSVSARSMARRCMVVGSNFAGISFVTVLPHGMLGR